MDFPKDWNERAEICRDERERQGKAEEAAKELVKEFEQEWEPVMENVKEANETFANLDGKFPCFCNLQSSLGTFLLKD